MTAALRLAEPAQLDPIAELERKAPRLANAIEATSRRRDVRELRARITLLLCALACPLRGRPTRSWYVPGAVARIGAEGIRRAWLGYFGEEPLGLRTIRAHLGALEQACVLVRSPGDWLPILRNPDHPERRPRYPDTLHLLRGDEAAEWWATVGRGLLAANPRTRCNPDKWAAIFQGWRARAADPNDTLAGGLFEELQARLGGRGPGSTVKEPRELPALETAARLDSLVRSKASQLELLGELRQADVHIRGKNALYLCREPERLRGAVAMLARALRRGDRIRNRAGWLVRCARYLPTDELRGAIRESFNPPEPGHRAKLLAK